MTDDSRDDDWKDWIDNASIDTLRTELRRMKMWMALIYARGFADQRNADAPGRGCHLAAASVDISDWPELYPLEDSYHYEWYIRKSALNLTKCVNPEPDMEETSLSVDPPPIQTVDEMRSEVHVRLTEAHARLAADPDGLGLQAILSRLLAVQERVERHAAKVEWRHSTLAVAKLGPAKPGRLDPL